MKNFLWVVVGILVLVGLFFLFKAPTGGTGEGYELGVMNSFDHVKGNASSTVVLMEYADFQCPACRTYYPVMRQLVQEFGGQIAFVFRHFPLTGIHANAEFAARAAEAAGKQGKFWEMHDLLFEKQTEWERTADVETLFTSYATLLGIDVEQFKLDWRSKEVKDFVANQRTHAVRSGLQGTPTFFVNGVQITNPNTADEFRMLIRNAINDKK